MSLIKIHTYSPNESKSIQPRSKEITKQLLNSYLFGREIDFEFGLTEVKSRVDLDNAKQSQSYVATTPTNMLSIYKNSTLAPPSNQITIPIELDELPLFQHWNPNIHPTPVEGTTSTTPEAAIDPQRIDIIPPTPLAQLKRKSFQPAPIVLTKSNVNSFGVLDPKRRKVNDSVDTKVVAGDGKELLESTRSGVKVIEKEGKNGENVRGILDATQGSSLALSRSNSIATEGGKTIDLGKGALLRCILPPYKLLPPIDADTSPLYQHACAIRHSFLDPPCSLPESVSRNSQFPRAFSNLQSGRQGSWIIPISSSRSISNKVLHPSISKATWNSRIGNSSKPSRENIYWTEDRLKGLWFIIRNLNGSGRMGYVHARCYFVEDFIQATSTTLTTTSSNKNSNQLLSIYFQSIDHIRVSVDANLALPLRSLLGLTDASKSISTTKGEEVKFKDGEKFLKNSGLIWTNELGEFVLVA